MGQHRIVVVDDHPLFLRGVVGVLEADGTVTRTHPDAVLVDLYLEDGSGLELLRRLRAAHGDALRLIVLTVSADPAEMLAAVRAGADGYLTKDQPPERLPRALRGAFAGEAALSRRMAAHLLRDARESREPAPAANGNGRGRLTPRQLEILQLIASGATTREIADTLVLSPETVRWHVKAILRKLGARTRAEAAAALREVGAAPAIRGLRAG